MNTQIVSLFKGFRGKEVIYNQCFDKHFNYKAIKITKLMKKPNLTEPEYLQGYHIVVGS